MIEITDSPPKKKNEKASRLLKSVVLMQGGGRGKSYEVMNQQFSKGNHMVCNLEQISPRGFFKY